MFEICLEGNLNNVAPRLLLSPIATFIYCPCNYAKIAKIMVYYPMWSHFGDAGGTPSGTYYYSGARHREFFWHIFDQVLIRPALIDSFQNESLKILSTDGAISFLSNRGVPDPSVASDHLPILFELNL